MTKEENPTKKTNRKVIIFISVVILFLLVCIFKDSILYNVDYTLRKNTLLHEFKNRTIVENLDAEGYKVNNYIGMKLDNVHYKDNKLLFDVLVKTNSNLENSNIFLSHGLFIYDDSMQFITAKENFFAPLYLRANEPIIAPVTDKANLWPVPVYSLGISKELHVNKNKLLKINNNSKLILKEIKLDGIYGKASYELPLPQNYSPESKLTIRITEPYYFIFKNSPFKELSNVFLEENFQEWIFKIDGISTK